VNDALRRAVWERAGDRCEYCLLPASCSILQFEIDHVIAEKHGGLTTLENLALACCYCNSFKGPNLSGIDPITKEIVRLFNLSKDIWDEHFFWNVVKLDAKTAIARATIHVLGINLPGNIRLRQALREENVFPFDY
jgi:5-methylcytosine-specific restriction endonuclease McrA